jgi:hypothetical protein
MGYLREEEIRYRHGMRLGMELGVLYHFRRLQSDE